MDKIYMPRLFDDVLDFALKSKGAVIVVGPKWCGKSTTTKRKAKTIVDLMRRSTRKSYVDYASIAPHEFLNDGAKPILIDEWQHVYFLWDDIKAEVDDNGVFGQYILTGSVPDKAVSDEFDMEDNHTANGRIIRKMMRPMSLFESGDSNGKVSILKLKEGQFIPCSSDKIVADYAYYICRGGWPLAINDNREISLAQAIDYYEVLVTDDIFSLKSIPLRKDEQKARLITKSYARNIATAASDQTLLGDCRSGVDSFDDETFKKYLEALKYLYVIEDLPAWNPFLRSKVAIRSKQTRHFVDPSIAAAALGITPEGLFKDMTTFGPLFESLCIRDLRIYCDYIGAKVYKYRDAKSREADAVIQFRDGSYALIEIKLGGDKNIDEAAKKLIKINEDIDKSKTGKPAFLMVITKGPVALRRNDGVYVVPLACLKP